MLAFPDSRLNNVISHPSLYVSGKNLFVEGEGGGRVGGRGALTSPVCKKVHMAHQEWHIHVSFTGGPYSKTDLAVEISEPSGQSDDQATIW